MNEVLDIVELGDAKEVTNGWSTGYRIEDPYTTVRPWKQ